MLAVPLKNTEQVNWSVPLLKYLGKFYSGKEVMEQSTSAQRVQSARARAANLRASDSSSLEAFGDYLKMICSIQSRFPMESDDVVINSHELRTINFVWFDAFKPSKSVSHQNILYERACMIFNYAALESHAGMVQDRATIDGVKSALAHFQNSAGAFEYLWKEIAEKNKLQLPVTTDLSPEGLGMLTNLMMAQAQACYFEKAIRDKHKGGVLSKLAAQTAMYYGEAARLASLPSMTAVLDKAWLIHLTFQHYCFSASAEYQYARAMHSKAEETGSGYGEEIARLKKAEEWCLKAKLHAESNKLPPTMLTTTNHLNAKIEADLRRGIEDNNKIYMDTVPPAASLKPLDGAAIAKATPFPKELCTPTIPGSEPVGGLFRSILPPHLGEPESIFRSKVASIMQDSGEKIQNASEDIRIRLAEAGLPGSVESGDKTQIGLPSVVWDRIVAQVHSRCGGVAGIQKLLENNKVVSKQVLSTLSKLESELHLEEQHDDECRREFGTASWKVTPSSEVNKQLFDDIARYQGLIAQATVSDDAVIAIMAENQALLSVLTKSKQELDASMPKLANLDNDPDIENLRLEVSLKLVDLGSKIQEVEQLQAKMVDEISSDSIVPALVAKIEKDHEFLNDKQQVTSLIESQLNKYRDQVRKMNDILLSIPRLFDAVLTKNFEFAEKRTQNAQTTEREQKVAEIDKAIIKFDEIAQHVVKGEQFYGDLVAHVAQLEVSTKDHLFVRDLQRNELAAELRQQIDKLADAPARKRTSLKPVIGRQGSTVPQVSDYNFPGEVIAEATLISSDTNSNLPIARADTTITDPILKDKVSLVRSTLGLDASVPNQLVIDYLHGAKGDVNLAINRYLEGVPPNGTNTPSQAQQQQQPPIIATQPQVFIGSSTASVPVAGQDKPKKKGWFR